jgi:NAD(P)-dependent dehydrogenase (short-subunit alcohol dehydrogenase family)
VGRFDGKVAPITGGARGQGRSHALVLVASMAGIKPLPYDSDHVAAKYGVVGLGRTLAIELGPHGTRSNVLCPGAVDTPMVDATAEENALTREQRLGQFENFELLDAGASIRPVAWGKQGWRARLADASGEGRSEGCRSAARSSWEAVSSRRTRRGASTSCRRTPRR